jgi:dihydrofolate reductase
MSTLVGWGHPPAIRVVVVAGRLHHAVQRDVCKDSDFSHLRSPSVSRGTYNQATNSQRPPKLAELVRGDLVEAVQQLKRESGKRLEVWGVTLPLALAALGLIDEYEFLVQPRLVGHGPTLFAGLSKPVDLKLVSRLEFGSGAVEMRYEPRR